MANTSTTAAATQKKTAKKTTKKAASKPSADKVTLPRAQVEELLKRVESLTAEVTQLKASAAASATQPASTGARSSVTTTVAQTASQKKKAAIAECATTCGVDIDTAKGWFRECDTEGKKDQGQFKTLWNLKMAELSGNKYQRWV